MVLIVCTPFIPFLARITLSLEERYMYFMPAIVMPLVAIASTLLYLAIKVLSSSGVTCNNEKDNLKIYFKVEKNLKGSLDLIPSPSPSVKIQIMGRKVS